MQTEFFDWHDRPGKPDKNDDPLFQLDKLIEWEQFRPALEQIRKKNKKSSPDPKYCDVILMFRILIIQSLYNLSDDAVEFHILDRLSVMRFLKPGLGDRVPYSKTIWLFRDQLTKANLIKKLFAGFGTFLRNNGCSAKKGQIADAGIVFEDLLDNSNSSRDVYADSAYRSGDSVERLKKMRLQGASSTKRQPS